VKIGSEVLGVSCRVYTPSTLSVSLSGRALEKEKFNIQKKQIPIIMKRYNFFVRTLRSVLGIDEIQQQIQQIQQKMVSVEISTMNLTSRQKNFLSVLLDGEFHSFSEIARLLSIKDTTARTYLHQLRRAGFNFNTEKEGKKLLLRISQQQRQHILNGKSTEIE